jgi:hypothetical protein
LPVPLIRHRGHELVDRAAGVAAARRQFVAVDRRPVVPDREALERQTADRLALHEVQWIGGRPGTAIDHVDRDGDVFRIEDLVEPAGRARLLRDDDRAPRRAANRIARAQTGDDCRRVRVGRTGKIDPLDGGIRRLLVADEQMRRVIVVRPQRNLIGREMHRAGHKRHVESLRDRERLGAVRSGVGTERALVERVRESE